MIEIAKNRTNPHLVPGIEAMLPDSPMARLLADAPPRPDIAMSVIAGDIEGGNLLARLGVLLTDFLLFDREDHDLVVNTTAMLAGIAPKAHARVLFDRGADVSHFRYFTNVGTRSALRDWLVALDPATVDAFHPLPDPKDYAAALAAATRDVPATDRPVVVVLPGVMGSYLQANGRDRVWFDPVDIATGGLEKIGWGRPGIEAEGLFGLFYGELCKALADSHRVERFPYDWRQPLDVLGERLGAFLDQLLKETRQPIRLLAHSMGGLVVRACIHRRRPVMDALMARDGARLVMLGTPHQGAHSMVENLLGKGDTLRMLVRLDVKHSLQQVLDIVAGFRGALALLPKPGFKDTFQGEVDGGGVHDYQEAQTWADFAAKVQDFWFGNGQVGRPPQAVLDSAAWLWRQDGPDCPSLPAAYEGKSVYVFGVAKNTPCGVREENGRLKMVGTTRGDGTVSWDSGRIGGIGQFYYMPAQHGDLPSTSAYFPALLDLLATGTTGGLPTSPPAARAIEQPRPVSYDAGPPCVDDPDLIARLLLGGSPRNRVPPRHKRRLDVRIRAMDLRFVAQPITRRPLRARPDRRPAAPDRPGAARRRPHRPPGPGPLPRAAGHRGGGAARAQRGRTPARQPARRGGHGARALRRGAQRRQPDRGGARRRAAATCCRSSTCSARPRARCSLSTLLLGYNSSANLTVAASVEALVSGVMEANARFDETTRLDIRIARLDIVELYVDTAITATYALRHLQERLAAQAALQQTQLVCRAELERGEGVRQRLFDAGNGAYWPRLIVTDGGRRRNARRRFRGRRAGDRARRHAALPLRRRPRPRRVGAAAAPARADREAGAPADPRPHMEKGLRADAVPAAGAARLQGHGATARPGGAGGRRDDGEPAVGADARRRPDPQ